MLRCLLVLLLILSSVGPANATEVWPTTVMLSKNRPIETIHIRNTAARTMIWELTAYRWSQEDGKDAVVSTNDLVAVPPIVELAPGEEAIVRVGSLVATEDTDREQAFRILLDEVSTFNGDNKVALNVRVRISLPVFVAPGEVSHDLRLSHPTRQGNEFCVQGANEGRNHVKVVWAESSGSRQSMNNYILSGSSKHICIPATTSNSPTTFAAGVTSAYQTSVVPHALSPSVLSRPGR